jgi:hypothetical protein
MRTACALLLCVAALAVPGTVGASWSRSATGSGAIKSKTMPAANGVPSGSVPLLSHNVTVTWSAAQFAGGGNVPGYAVKRYDSLTHTLQTILSACSGIVAATSCVENSVPTGSWVYTVTPAAGIWRGTESGFSAAVVVGP